jgi:hypothetical protein
MQLIQLYLIKDKLENQSQEHQLAMSVMTLIVINYVISLFKLSMVCMLGQTQLTAHFSVYCVAQSVKPTYKIDAQKVNKSLEVCPSY